MEKSFGNLCPRWKADDRLIYDCKNGLQLVSKKGYPNADDGYFTDNPEGWVITTVEGDYRTMVFLYGRKPYKMWLRSR